MKYYNITSLSPLFRDVRMAQERKTTCSEEAAIMIAVGHVLLVEIGVSVVDEINRIISDETVVREGTAS